MSSKYEIRYYVPNNLKITPEQEISEIRTDNWFKFMYARIRLRKYIIYYRVNY